MERDSAIRHGSDGRGALHHRDDTSRRAVRRRSPAMGQATSSVTAFCSPSVFIRLLRCSRSRFAFAFALAFASLSLYPPTTPSWDMGFSDVNNLIHVDDTSTTSTT